MNSFLTHSYGWFLVLLESGQSTNGLIKVNQTQQKSKLTNPHSKGGDFIFFDIFILKI
jgi:hypothetical protein